MKNTGRFTEKGSYLIEHPDTPTKWENKLFNDEYVLDITQRLEGIGSIVENYVQSPILDSARRFYLKYNGVETRLFCGNLGTFSAEYDIDKMIVCEENDTIKVVAEVTVPAKGKYELWRFTVESKVNDDIQCDLFCFYPFANKGPMGAETKLSDNKKYVSKFSFPHHAKYEEKARVEKNHGYTFVLADTEISSFDGVAHAFYGSDNTEAIPVAVKNGSCSNTKGQGDRVDAAVHFSRKITGGKTFRVTLMLGPSNTAEEIEVLSANTPDFDTVCKESEAFRKKAYAGYTIDTPNQEMNYLFNLWLPKQVVYLTRLNRGGVCCPVRNQLQDALGYSILDPKGALEFALRVLRRQHTNGYLKQWYMTDNSPESGLCKINHSDACIWLVLCITEIISNIGDKTLFMQNEPYMDSEEQESILTHLKKAVHYMYSMCGEHGLCLMLDGDWTDPINGAGRKGKGESVWNSMALIYAIQNLTELFPDDGLTKIAEELTEAINKYCWDGQAYIVGFDDDGKAFGSVNAPDGKLFLNTQTWAIISGVVPEERMPILKNSIEKLKVPFGWLLLDKPFFAWDETWGRISIKQPGTTENGSVYCHATMFKALSDCIAGSTDDALDALMRTLPTNPENPTEKNLQLPLFVPNYYFGIQNENFGKSSCKYGTGTTAWMIWLMIKHVLGIKTTVDGIVQETNVPQLLKGSTVTRRFKDAEYTFTID